MIGVAPGGSCASTVVPSARCV